MIDALRGGVRDALPGDNLTKLKLYNMSDSGVLFYRSTRPWPNY